MCAPGSTTRVRPGFHSPIGYAPARLHREFAPGRSRCGIGVRPQRHGAPLALRDLAGGSWSAFIPLVGAVVTGFLAVARRVAHQGYDPRSDSPSASDHRSRCSRIEAHVAAAAERWDGCEVSIHPLAVRKLAIAAGRACSPSIVGAQLAGPVIAFLSNAVRVLVADDPDAEQALSRRGVDGPVIEATARRALRLNVRGAPRERSGSLRADAVATALRPARLVRLILAAGHWSGCVAAFRRSFVLCWRPSTGIARVASSSPSGAGVARPAVPGWRWWLRCRAVRRPA